MKLKYQLLLLALLSLLFPVTGWFALKSVDKEFRLSIEQASNNTLLSLKASVQQMLQNNSELKLHGLVPTAIEKFILDGDDSEWSNVSAYHYHNKADKLAVKIGKYNNTLVILIASNDASISINSIDSHNNDHVIMALANDRGLYKYKLQRQAQGLLLHDLDLQNKPDYQAYWHEKARGYILEVQFESNDFHHLGFASVNKTPQTQRVTGTLQTDTTKTLKLLPIVSGISSLQDSINSITPQNNAFIIKDSQGRIIYQSNKLPSNQSVSAWQWIVTPIYQWLFNIDNTPENKWFYQPDDGMAGIKHITTEDGITYELISMMPQGQQSMIQTLLKAGVLMIAVVLLLMLAYLGYSLLLAWRIKNLNRAMQTVLDDSGDLHIQMPSRTASDEIGGLSRGIESMLGEMREYTQYLQDLGSRLSHEMKTPLAIVQSSLDNLELENNPEFLQRAKLGTHRLKFILNQLSEVSKLKYTLENTPREKFNLTELCQQLGNSYMSFIPNLRLNIIDKDIYIRGSSDLMAQLLDKLIDNAQDFTPDSGYIELGLYADKEHVFLYLTNSGSQLPNNPQINIFDSLVTARPKNKQDQSSNSSHLGLGLHIVQLIARYHHSKVSAINSTNPDRVQFVIKLKQQAFPQ